MKPLRRHPRPFLLLALMALPLATSCKTGASVPSSHWNVESVPPRVIKHFTGYAGPLDGSYKDYQWEKKQSINLTLRRHFLNNNPKNPFEPFDPNLDKPRPTHSILPQPWYFIHVDGLLNGLVVLAWSNAYVPAPIDSLIGMATPGGPAEFWEGIEDTFTGKWGDREVRPPKVKDFKVKNR